MRQHEAGHLDAQNKVLVIMDDGIFRKQAYRGTGCERGSSEGVTVSIQAQKRVAARGEPEGRLDAIYRFR